MLLILYFLFSFLLLVTIEWLLCRILWYCVLGMMYYLLLFFIRFIVWCTNHWYKTIDDIMFILVVESYCTYELSSEYSELYLPLEDLVDTLFFLLVFTVCTVVEKSISLSHTWLYFDSRLCWKLSWSILFYLSVRSELIFLLSLLQFLGRCTAIISTPFIRIVYDNVVSYVSRCI